MKSILKVILNVIFEVFKILFDCIKIIIDSIYWLYCRIPKVIVKIFIVILVINLYRGEDVRKMIQNLHNTSSNQMEYEIQNSNEEKMDNQKDYNRYDKANDDWENEYKKDYEEEKLEEPEEDYSTNQDTVKVDGYYRDNGTYVDSYERTPPDGIEENNFSYNGR